MTLKLKKDLFACSSDELDALHRQLLYANYLFELLDLRNFCYAQDAVSEKDVTNLLELSRSLDFAKSHVNAVLDEILEDVTE